MRTYANAQRITDEIMSSISHNHIVLMSEVHNCVNLLRDLFRNNFFTRFHFYARPKSMSMLLIPIEIP